MNSSSSGAHDGPVGRALRRGALASRWLLVPFLAVLVFALALVGKQFMTDIIHLFAMFGASGDEDITLGVLNLLDKFMVATLLVTTILGSYHIYISPVSALSEWTPPWLDHMTAKELKVITSLSLAGVTGIGLLKDFHQKVSVIELVEHVVIHFTFILSAMAIALVAKWMHSKDQSEEVKDKSK